MQETKSGFLLINKPTGITSFDVIYKLRKITGVKKIGHAGTLDPFASGLLIVAVGREATKQISKYLKQDKTYVATLKLGFETDTYDLEGENKSVSDKQPSLKQVQEVLKSFEGKQKQIPPMFSAKKIKGKKLYDLARQGIEVERQPVDIEIFNINLIEYNYPELKIETKVTSGTYIRSLGHDIGKKLGVGAYLTALQRTSIGEFSLDQAKILEQLNQNWQQYLT